MWSRFVIYVDLRDSVPCWEGAYFLFGMSFCRLWTRLISCWADWDLDERLLSSLSTCAGVLQIIVAVHVRKNRFDVQITALQALQMFSILMYFTRSVLTVECY